MGLGIGFSKSSFEISSTTTLSKPDPKNYSIIKHEELGKYLLIMINYPDCSNYEGNKILLFKGIKLKDLKKQKMIDPHFSDNDKYWSPVARFEPTELGWNMALQLIATLRSSDANNIKNFLK